MPHQPSMRSPTTVRSTPGRSRGRENSPVTEPGTVHTASVIWSEGYGQIYPTLKQFRVLVADDQSIVRAGLSTILNRQPDIEVVGQAADGRETVALARELRRRVPTRHPNARTSTVSNHSSARRTRGQGSDRRRGDHGWVEPKGRMWDTSYPSGGRRSSSSATSARYSRRSASLAGMPGRISRTGWLGWASSLRISAAMMSRSR